MTTSFRVWDGSQMHEPPHGFFLDGTGDVLEAEGMPADAVALFNTGLTDAEGTEVWEGDVLEYTDDSPSHVVAVWDDDVAQFRIRLNNGDTLPFHSYDHLSDHYRVVGNKHEHPELMQEVSA